MSKHPHAPKAAPSSSASPADGFDASLFKSSHRVHVQDNAVFTFDHHLVVNPAEAAPENEPQLISKTIRHFSSAHPSFYAYPARANVALHLASFIPVSHGARKETLIKQAQDLYVAEKTGEHPQDAATALRNHSPMTAYIKGHREGMQLSPAEMEVHRNGMVAYLLIGQALHRNGYRKEAAAYLAQLRTPDALMQELGRLINIPSETLAAAMRDKGVDGLAQALNVNAATLSEIKQVTEKASQQFFSSNLIHNWMAGRSIAGLNGKPLDEVIEVGKLARTAHSIEAVRTQLANLDKPTLDGDAMQDRVVSIVRDMPKALQQALYFSNTEISVTPAHNVSPLLGHPETALGQHWFLPYAPGSNDGVRHIYVSGADSIQQLSRVLQHEAHHLTFPNHFEAAELASMDELLRQSSAHLKELGMLCEAWLVATPAERVSVQTEINDRFKKHGITLDAALGGSFNEARMHRLVEAVNHANAELDTGSLKLSRLYPTPESRAAEMVSRFAAIKFVDLRDAPEMLRFICPQMEKLYADHYIAHLQREVKQMQQSSDEKLPLPDKLQSASSHLMTDLAAGKYGNSQAYEWDDAAPQLMVVAASAETEPMLGGAHIHSDAKSHVARLAAQQPSAVSHSL